MFNVLLRIVVIVGEVLGDVFVVGMICVLKCCYFNVVFEGIVGLNMQVVGCKSLFDIEILFVMGLVEVFFSICCILGVKNVLIEYFEKYFLDVYIGVDVLDFNLWVEKVLKVKGIKIVYYVSFIVWVWCEKCIFKIVKVIYCVLGIFFFEYEVYDKY